VVSEGFSEADVDTWEKIEQKILSLKMRREHARWDDVMKI
jgi:hypothetical protein